MDWLLLLRRSVNKTIAAAAAAGLLMLGLVPAIGADAAAQNADSISVVPADTTVRVDSTVQYEASYFDSTGVEVDTSFVWSVTDTSIAEIDSTRLLTALATGETNLTASVGEVTGTASVEVEANETEEEDEEEEQEETGWTIALSPSDTTVAVGDSVEFSASVTDSNGVSVDSADVSWSLAGQVVGKIDTTGLLTTSSAGTGFVRAAYDTLEAEAKVVVNDTTDSDTSGTHVVRVIRPKPNPSQAPPDTITVQEGDSYTLGGFPHPLQLLNGGVLTFPTGSLTEDIELVIEIEGFAEVNGQDVNFPDGVVTGADFIVQKDGTPVEGSYSFEKPITIALPYKRGVIKTMGIDPTEISMFFYEEDAGSLNDAGISNVAVDSSKNRIVGDVAHLTPVVLAGEKEATAVADPADLPDGYALDSNYPNPFNPTTTIRFELPARSEVHLTVYDALGRQVARLVEGARSAGVHTVRFEAQGLSSGLYFYRLEAGEGGGAFVRTRKMLLLK